jgi:hypothetical protein
MAFDELEAVSAGTVLGWRYRLALGETEVRVSEEQASMILALVGGDVRRAEAFVEQAIGRALWLVGAFDQGSRT